jgi:PAS domain S-box-containing protein
MPREPDVATSILKILKFEPKGMTITDLSEKIGISRNSISRHMDMLLVSGQVELRNIGTAKVFYPAQRVPLSAFLCFTKNLILVLDDAQRIVQINDQCLKLLRRTKDEMIGRTLEEAMIPAISTPQTLSVIEGLEQEQIITDLQYQSDGQDHFLQMQVIPTTFNNGEKGCTLVIEDITERKRFVRNMEFLARTAMELVNLPLETDIYKYIAMRVAELVPKARIFVDSYDEIHRQFVMRAILNREFREGLQQLVGSDVVGMTFRVADLSGAPHRETVASVFTIQEHVFNPGGRADDWSFYDLCFRQIPREICDEIQSRFNIGKVIGISIIWQDRLFGVVGIFLPPGKDLENRHAIESFVRQASISIARRQTEERLRSSEQRFREVINLSPIPASIVDAEGRFIFLNQAFTDFFGYTLADIPTGRDWFGKVFPDPGYSEEAIAVWKSDLAQTGPGEVRPRIFRVRCMNGDVKNIRFQPATMSDGNLYITYEEIAR